MDAATIYGCPNVQAPASGGSFTAHMAPSVVPEGLAGLVSPRNPLMWFGVIMLATVGAAGLAGSVRLGPAKLSGSVGKA
jgi:hypothetical protein